MQALQLTRAPAHGGKPRWMGSSSKSSLLLPRSRWVVKGIYSRYLLMSTYNMPLNLWGFRTRKPVVRNRIFFCYDARTMPVPFHDAQLLMFTAFLQFCISASHMHAREMMCCTFHSTSSPTATVHLSTQIPESGQLCLTFTSTAPILHQDCPMTDNEFEIV